ncbi:hypothetical protein BJ684DRAFT_20191 [Piptocephalis cylindrospora]|uniref:Uncharacterized protein n=1 Tax=Piptocephalis cylindrospora TaxID=1907219 RepID=A0A4P9Y649_9FUNG|nr:hypothetical protein BJ684DRAFT_20191 [Piptocephalis cylindrospora]|eukprot:RKP13300.1 hypothetical protein BJ684DRAFT_20191 [Piptocephalis cylindrospora]
MPLIGKVRGFFRRTDEGEVCPPLDPTSIDSLVTVLSFPEAASNVPKVLDALVALCSTNAPDTTSTDTPILTFNLTPLAKPVASKVLSEYIQVAETALGVIRYLLENHISTLTLHAPIFVPALLHLAFHPPPASWIPDPVASSPWKSFFSRSTPTDPSKKEEDIEDEDEDKDTRAAQAHRLLQDMVITHHLPQIVSLLCRHLSVSPSALYPPEPSTEGGDEEEKGPQHTHHDEPISEQVVEWIATAVETIPPSLLLPYAADLEEMIQKSALDPSLEVRQCSVRVYLLYLRLPSPSSSPSPAHTFQATMSEPVRKSLSAGLRSALIQRKAHRSPSTKSDESVSPTSPRSLILGTWPRSLSAEDSTRPSPPPARINRRSTLMSGAKRRWRDSRTSSMLLPTPTPRIELSGLSSPSSKHLPGSDKDDFVSGALAGLGKIQAHPAVEEDEEPGEDQEGDCASDQGLAPPLGRGDKSKSVRPSRSDSGLPILSDGDNGVSTAKGKGGSTVKASSWSLRRGLSSLWRGGSSQGPSPTVQPTLVVGQNDVDATGISSK